MKALLAVLLIVPLIAVGLQTDTLAAWDFFLAPYDGVFSTNFPSSNHEALRNELFRSPWTQLDRMFDVGHVLRRIEQDLHGALTRFGFGLDNASPVDFLAPAVPVEVTPKEKEEMMKDQAEGGSQNQLAAYRINVPLGTNIGPEDVKVSLKDRVMTIEAKKEQKSKDGHARIYQEFVRKFTLPEKVDVKGVKSILTPQGYLKIEAPVPKVAEPKEAESVTETTEKKEEPIKKREAVEIPIDAEEGTVETVEL